MGSREMAGRHRAHTVALDYGHTGTSSRCRTPAIPTYTEALIKSSQRLRERSMSPPPPMPPMEKVSPYKCNMDYYRGKVKSVYEKEPCFKAFVRNIPLSESNMYDMNNLTRIKRRFSSLVQDRWGRDSTPDPLKPSRVSEKVSVSLSSGNESVNASQYPQLENEI